MPVAALVSALAGRTPVTVVAGLTGRSRVDAPVRAAEWLNQQVLGHKVSDLVVFAAPRTLGEIRKHYHKLTEQALLGEVNKSMAGRSPSELIEALREPA